MQRSIKPGQDERDSLTTGSGSNGTSSSNSSSSTSSSGAADSDRDTPDDSASRSQDEVANFRNFDLRGYSTESIVSTRDRLQVVYVLVSLFSTLFSRQSHVTQMMRDNDIAFDPTRDAASGYTVSPIFYINTRKLQEITEPIFFPAKSSATQVTRARGGPLHNAEAKWLSLFYQAELELEQEKKLSQSPKNSASIVRLRRHILPWECFLADSAYSAIYNFMATEIFLMEHNDAGTNEFESAISEIVLLFAQHNLKKFKKADETCAISQEETQTLRHYLAEEFSVFLLLAAHNSLQSLRHSYKDAGVNIAVSITETTVIQPVLVYPVSAGGELSEKTFSLFLKIQDHYIAQCSIPQSSLPRITTPLQIADSLVSSNNQQQRQNFAASAASSFLSHDSLQHSRTTYVPIPASNHTRYFKLPDVSCITEKIIDMILNHKETGDEDVELSYRNRIKCNVSVTGKLNGEVISESSDPETQIKALRDRINSAVNSTWETGIDEKRKFIFRGYRFELKASSLQTEQLVEHAPGHK